MCHMLDDEIIAEQSEMSCFGQDRNVTLGLEIEIILTIVLSWKCFSCIAF